MSAIKWDGPSAGKPPAGQPDKVIAYVRGLYDKALAAQNDTAETAWWNPFGEAPQQDANRANIAQLKTLIDTWATVYRRWAETGKRDDGTGYSWDRWTQYGQQDLASAAAVYAKCAVDGSPFNAMKAAVKQTIDDANPFNWPWWVKGGIAAVVLGVGFLYLRPYLPRRVAA